MTNSQIAVATTIFVCILIVVGFMEAPPPVPPTPERTFQQLQKQRCDAMQGRLDFDGVVARCYHTPLFRHPKLMFTEKFKQ